MLGGTQSAWIKVAVIFGLISLLSLFILYKVSKENVQIVEKSEDENVPFVEGIKILFKNKYWVIMLALQFLMNISYSLSTSGGTYYAKYILGNDNIVALLGAVGLIPTFLGFILTGPMASKLGMTKTCMISCAMLSQFVTYMEKMGQDYGIKELTDPEVLVSNIIDSTVSVAVKMHLGYMKQTDLKAHTVYQSVFALLFHMLQVDVWDESYICTA